MATLLLSPAHADFGDRLRERLGGAVNQDMETAGAPLDPATLPDGIRVQRDIAYGSSEKQRMDVYLPRHAPKGPVIFFVHGGAWMVGDKGADAVVRNKVARWVSRGFIFVSVNYPLYPAAEAVEQADNVAKALALAQSRAKEWGGDPGRFLVMGHSAGAHLVALLSSDPAIARRQGASPWLGTVALDSAALDLVQIMGASHRRFYDRVFHDKPGYWREASPAHRLAADGPPMLLVCSTKREDSCPQAQSFATRGKALGRKMSVLPVAMTHMEINNQLGATRDYTDSVESFMGSVGLKPE